MPNRKKTTVLAQKIIDHEIRGKNDLKKKSAVNTLKPKSLKPKLDTTKVIKK